MPIFEGGIQNICFILRFSIAVDFLPTQDEIENEKYLVKVTCVLCSLSKGFFKALRINSALKITSFCIYF